MLFSSITFLYYFLPAVLVIYYLASAKVKNLILFLASFVFYLWGEPKYSVLLLFSVTAGYMGGRCIEYQRQKKCVCAADPADRSGKYKGGHDRLVVGIFTAMTLGLLVFFKYMDFLADSVNRILGITCSDGADRTSGRHQFLHVSDHQLLCGCLPGRGCGRTQFC